MISGEFAETAKSYFGWRVVGAAVVLAVFGWGLGFFGPSVFLRTLHDQRGWTIATISAAITAHFLFSALFVAYLPEAYTQWGFARVTQVGILCTAIGAMLWGNATSTWQLFPIAVVSGAGSAATPSAAINAIVALGFVRSWQKRLSQPTTARAVAGLALS